jgi:predicted glycoside hydrolase/deacetylase ChbG (UPF0249 family)
VIKTIGVLTTGDDFGESTRVNEAVERDFEAGYLRQASLLVGGNAVDEALRIARRHPQLCVGLHLAVTEMTPLSGAVELKRNGHGMESRPHAAGLRYTFDRSLRQCLKQEIEAQFDAFKSSGLPHVYFDGHMHMHLHPVIRSIAWPIAGKHGFRAYRSVRERTFGMYEMIFRALTAAAARSELASGFASNSESRGLRHTFAMTPELVHEWIRTPPRRCITEWVYHPGKEPKAWDARRAAELLTEASIATTSWLEILSTTV